MSSVIKGRGVCGSGSFPSDCAAKNFGKRTTRFCLHATSNKQKKRQRCWEMRQSLKILPLKLLSPHDMKFGMHVFYEQTHKKKSLKNPCPKTQRESAIFVSCSHLWTPLCISWTPHDKSVGMPHCTGRTASSLCNICRHTSHLFSAHGA